jgi:hypothetical protein
VEELLLGVTPHFEAAFASAAFWFDGGVRCDMLYALDVEGDILMYKLIALRVVGDTRYWLCL